MVRRVVARADGAARPRSTDEGKPTGVDDQLGRVLLEVALLISKQAFVIVVPEREARGGAGAGNLKLVDDLFPELPLADLHRAAADVNCFEQLAEV